MTLSCIIIEDEPLAIEKLEGFIRDVPFLNLLGSFEKAMDGLSFLKSGSVDLVFLDIQMEQLTGIQLLETLTVKPYIIITSAYSEYALKGYELCVFDYLLKPYSFERFLSAVNRVYDDLLLKNQNKNSEENIFVKTEYRVENIPVNEILYIEGMREYLQIGLPNKKIMTKMNFRSLLAILPAGKFIQVHKSWVVSIPKIESVERNRIKIGNKLIPVGDSYKDAFWMHINNNRK
jgi:two-component system, LytTR family, response regulator